MSSNYDDTTEAKRRFYELANRNQAAQGLPPIPTPAPELPPSMQHFVHAKRGGETEAFIEENQRRLNAGLPQIGVNGLPIMPKGSPQGAPSQPTLDKTDPMYGFFTGAEDFEGRTPAGYEGVKVKRYK